MTYWTDMLAVTASGNRSQFTVNFTSTKLTEQLAEFIEYQSTMLMQSDSAIVSVAAFVAV